VCTSWLNIELRSCFFCYKLNKKCLKNKVQTTVDRQIIKNHHNLYTCILSRGRRGCDRMVVGITTTYAISAYHHKICKFESRSWQGVLDTTLHDKVCQWLVAGRWFSPGTLVSSTNKTDCHDRTEILLKVVIKAITLTLIFKTTVFYIK
jgi:hypothetical protein